VGVGVAGGCEACPRPNERRHHRRPAALPVDVARVAAATPVAAGADRPPARQPPRPAHLPCEGHGADADVLDPREGVV
jgi:hypothetical protein